MYRRKFENEIDSMRFEIVLKFVIDEVFQGHWWDISVVFFVVPK